MRDRGDRALGLAGAALDALVRVDVEDAIGVLVFDVDAAYRANIDAGLVLDVDAGLSNDIGHWQTSQEYLRQIGARFADRARMTTSLSNACPVRFAATREQASYYRPGAEAIVKEEGAVFQGLDVMDDAALEDEHTTTCKLSLLVSQVQPVAPKASGPSRFPGRCDVS